MKLGLQQQFSPPSKLLHFPTEVTGNSLTEGLIIIVIINLRRGSARDSLHARYCLNKKLHTEKLLTSDQCGRIYLWSVVPPSQGMISSAKLRAE